MSTDRDTHFAGFAKLLLGELLESGDVHIDTGNPHWRAEWEQIIARRTYDLMSNAINAWGFPPAMLYIGDVPDLTEWPKGQA